MWHRNKRSIIIPGEKQIELNLSFTRGLDEKHRQTALKINKTDYIRQFQRAQPCCLLPILSIYRTAQLETVPYKTPRQNWRED